MCIGEGFNAKVQKAPTYIDTSLFPRSFDLQTDFVRVPVCNDVAVGEIVPHRNLLNAIGVGLLMLRRGGLGFGRCGFAIRRDLGRGCRTLILRNLLPLGVALRFGRGLAFGWDNLIHTSLLGVLGLCLCFGLSALLFRGGLCIFGAFRGR